MVAAREDDLEQRVLVCAPHGRDAQLIAKMLSQSGICSQPLLNIEDLAAELSAGAAAAIITEEALYSSVESLVAVMNGQPAWSDLPVIVLTTGGDATAESTWALIQRLEPIGNVILLERPLRAMTLVSAVLVALRSRARQYEVRSLYEDLERRVAERTAELTRLNEEAEGFSYTISHDLRSPLRAIISSSRILVEDYGEELSPEAVSELNRQAENAARLAQLIDDLLKLSRLSREQMHPKEFDLSALAESVAGDLAREQEMGRCEFEIQPGMKAFGDPVLIRLVLLNLMQNACKFSPKGGTIRVAWDGNAFYVEDQGIGFSPDYAKRIFLPFERLVHQREFPGTGIGLANVKRIIERHGGAVWADSQPEKGARFFFRLPGS